MIDFASHEHFLKVYNTILELMLHLACMIQYGCLDMS
jgi:hypothetical protein